MDLDIHVYKGFQILWMRHFQHCLTSKTAKQNLKDMSGLIQTSLVENLKDMSGLIQKKSFFSR